MNENQKSLDWRFWQQWVLFSTLSYGIGGVLGWWTLLLMGVLMGTLLVFLAYPQPYSSIVMAGAMALGGAVAGAMVGLMQWEAVRLKAPPANKKTWMKLNIVGMAISWTLLFGILEILTERLGKVGIWIDGPTGYTLLSVIAAGGLWGILFAANMWHILHGQIKHTALWFTVNSLCGMLVFAIGWIWIWIPDNPSSNGDEYSVLAPLVLPSILTIILWPIAGLLYGLMTVRLNEHVLVG